MAKDKRYRSKAAPAAGEDYFKLSQLDLQEDYELVNFSIPDKLLEGSEEIMRANG